MAFGLAVVLASGLASGLVPTISVDVNVSAGTSPFPHVWERAFGSGHALLATRADWQQQLQRCVAEIGLRGVRMHGILDDDMSVTPDGKTYFFHNVDVVFDFLVKQAVRPIVELSFMPCSIAQDKDARVFGNRGGYKGCTSPPTDYNLWYNLIKAFATHLLERYGIGVLAGWQFEVWNEMWGMPYPTAYVPLYNASARALKAVHPALQVGGPSSANLEHVADLLAAATSGDIPLDFLSTHHYPSDPSCSHAEGPNAMRAECFTLDVLESAAVAKNASLPYILSEYKDGLQGGPGTGYGGQHGDTAYAAAFVTHTLPLLTSLDVVSWWTFSDIFEENWMIGRPFYGGYGLLTVDNVAKPAYRAFELLSRAGIRRLDHVAVEDPAPQYMGESTLTAFATLGDARGVGDDLQLFLTNFGPEEGTSPKPWVPSARNVSLRLARAPSRARPGAPSREGRVGAWPTAALLRRIDDNSTAPLAAWMRMGSPSSLTPTQLAELHAVSQTKDTWLPLVIDGERATLQVELPAYGIAHLSIAS